MNRTRLILLFAIAFLVLVVVGIALGDLGDIGFNGRML